MKSLFFVLFCSITSVIFGQSTTVNALNYNSTTRDTLIEFPNGDHNQYKKIIMHYSMRCKDGLVSPGIAGQTNIGCGEWDYSCNTNIVDSTQVDSLKRVGPDHVISGFEGTLYEFTTQPIYTTVRQTIRDVEYNTSNLISIIDVGEGTQGDLYDIGLDGDVKTHLFLVTGADIQSQGVTAGEIGRMRWDVFGNSSQFDNLRISMRSTSADEVSATELFSGAWTEVYQNNIEIKGGVFLNFYQNFMWDGSSNILIQMNYESSSDSPVRFYGDLDSDKEVLTVNGSDDKYVTCGPSGNFIAEEGIPDVSDEITVSFWSFGDHKLPVNTTIFEGVDAANRRQANVHLPWSNGQVYWDCGGNGGNYDRINMVVNPDDFKNKWTHWAFTKNVSTGIMNIYLNGELLVTGSEKSNPIDIKRFSLGSSSGLSPTYWQGSLDDFQVWNKEFSQEEIKSRMRSRVDASHPDYSNLMMYFDFDGDVSNGLVDKSSYNNNMTANGQLIQRDWRSHQLVKNISIGNKVPNFFLLKGNYQYDVVETQVDNLIENLPSRVDRYVLEGTDRVLDETFYYYTAGEQPIFDEDYNQIGTEVIAGEDFIFIQDMNYFSKSPLVYELMSFVTPYGINLDLGIEGKTWSFDVTEFGPILKGNKRIFMNRGGQWQEDMDIRFEFVEGTPVRDVVNITQLWPVTSSGYQDILNNNRFEPREVNINNDTKSTEMKGVITGHGQEGEFIPRTHTMSMNGVPLSYQVWTECSDNPVYPQGGTWVYDRAGWCPGAPSDVQRFDVTDFISSMGSNIVDYSINTAAGDSRYIVNMQLVEYGDPNYSNDVELLQIRNPSSEIIHERYNPACQAPVIKIRNNGTQPLTQLEINYGFDNDGEVLLTDGQTYLWNGNLGFLEEEEIELPFFPGLTLPEGAKFRVKFNGDDEDTDNNTLVSDIRAVDHYDNDVIIQFKTNFVSSETSYTVYDQNGTVVLQKLSSSVAGNTVYTDTLRNLNGCYQLVINDTGGDGLSWWANNDGDGYVAVRADGAGWTTLPADFGSVYRYDFTTGIIVSTDDVTADEVMTIFPNPVSAGLYIELDNRLSNGSILITNEMGQQLHTENINGRTDFYIEEINRFTSGVYHLTVITESSTFTQRFVKI
ncbi:MAG TPA: hypothetical protein DCW83_12485 [Saprospirales bacterium]|nr:hypothetical protein [Saprospirales bacterium]